MLLLVEFLGLALKGLPEKLFWVWPAPNVNSWEGTSTVGREKIDVAPMLLNGVMGTGSLLFGKPKLKEGRPTGGKIGKFGMQFSVDPKTFCSYSCNCWYTAIFTGKKCQVRIHYLRMKTFPNKPQHIKIQKECIIEEIIPTNRTNLNETERRINQFKQVIWPKDGYGFQENPKWCAYSLFHEQIILWDEQTWRNGYVVHFLPTHLVKMYSKWALSALSRKCKRMP